MSTKIEARRCSEKAEAQSRKSGQRYEIAVKAVFADLGRCSEHDKTENFDSNLTATELFDKSSSGDWGQKLGYVQEAPRPRSVVAGTMVAPDAMERLLQPSQR